MPVILLNEHYAVPPSTAGQLRRSASIILQLLGMSWYNVTIILTDDNELRRLNRTYRSIDKTTNVLSFPFAEGLDPAVQSLELNELGDIVISVDKAKEETRLNGQPLAERLIWLMVHGFLHLVGYDHERSPNDERLMFSREQEIITELHNRRRVAMVRLAVNVDHIATIRQARGGVEPDPVTAAAMCELAGAEGIVVHLREDRRHIQDRDVRLLRETIKTKLNLEMGAAREIIDFALDLKPDMVTLVPEKRKELTTEGGLDIVSQKKKLTRIISTFNQAGIPVSLFLDPDRNQVIASQQVGATFVELHTGAYSEAKTHDERERQFEFIRSAAEEAHLLGLRVNAGHGLNYINTTAIAALDTIEELSIGHAIISRAVLSGLDQAVREMREQIDRGIYS